MEVANTEVSSNVCNGTLNEHNIFEVSSNWHISNDRRYCDAITTSPSSQACEKIELEDIVSLETCIYLQSEQPTTSSTYDPCMLDIKVTNGQKIAHIAIVSEAYVLEFFKQFGEYATTIFAEFVDQFKGNSVYFAEANIDPPATETSIKFTKVRSTGTSVWIYGIKLFLTEPVEENNTSLFNHDVIKSFLCYSTGSIQKEVNTANKVLETFSNHEDHSTSNEDLFYKKFIELSLHSLNHKQSEDKIVKNNSDKINSNCKTDNTKSGTFDIKTYIDIKFHDMETKLIQKINEIEQKTNQKLDAILKKLEITSSAN